MPSITITKDRISSPLEAGPSLLEAKQLSPQLTVALDYVSSRLARKRLHLSLIVVRKDTQIPQHIASSQVSPKRADSPGHSITTSPARSLFGGSSFTRMPSKSSLSSISDTSSSTSSSSSTASLSRTNWPSLPTSPADRTVSPSATPAQPASPATPNPYGITLMHASTLTEKAEKILRHVIAKAEKKFSIGSGWLSPAPLNNNTACPLTNDLIRCSLAQNEILFSSEGLTLLALDHVYAFKCHLHTYSRTLTPFDLTSAVDELRRLVLAQQGRRITKGYLMRAYAWLGVSLAALVDVNEGYKVAYGGRERTGGIEVANEERKSPPPLNTKFLLQTPSQTRHHQQQPRKLRLTIGSDLSSRSALGRRESCCESSCSSDDEARTLASVAVGESAKGRDFTVAEVLREDRGPHRRGAVTPNGYEDITPVTKGEWCFLMVGEGWKEAKTAPVVTC
ncbi:uncharacterized protein L3040_000740 [Drepanopeziza brunnea f. sp. 'multigermtubi']|uniref:DUF7582 domain-containing protein n=1 Tax=Marssonina brunnea f. sp. multigermtubi (strain MB_m1) TaxID=1072389 RepID=K1XKW3_MARBU|nr:uncharacterized protein MBM_00331 [Drepanopeziza brunnea f. sp. 'multigermtubi' MB_m1]EKD21218.1 hypothetical protein MBM_00331 [Drepanopeziza brunnea f. sp. 'multigermtubi' MB_m1]KAJ5054466.1 hypothetical protein L3040_000740 [Drepanopeziza brunnea f. sp. 'multigermtubi']